MTPDQRLDRRDELTLADDKLERVQKILFSRRSKGEALAQAFELVKEVRQHVLIAKAIQDGNDRLLDRMLGGGR